jgi:hypothetical protein
MNPMNLYYPKSQKSQDYLGHPLHQATPLRHHDRMNQKSQNYPMILSYLENLRCLVYQEGPLHRHDLNFQMSRMIRNLYHSNHLNHLTPRNYYHQFH